MNTYEEMLKKVLECGEVREDRTGTGTLSLFDVQGVFNLDTFPLVTTKKINWKNIIIELLWFISGNTNIRPLLEQGVRIWTEWPLEKYNSFAKGPKAKEAVIDAKPMSKKEFEKRILEDSEFAQTWGDLGPVYGKQWRDFGGVDQLQGVIDAIQTNPFSRRHIVSAWNPGELSDMALQPSHAFFQFYVSSSGKLSCKLTQRSADMFLGVPYNIASYAALTLMVAQVCGLEPGKLHMSLGDAHIYSNHLEQVHKQLSREPKDPPLLAIDKNVKNINDFKLEHFSLFGYNPHPFIKAPISV